MLQSAQEVLFQSYTDVRASGPDFNSVVTMPNKYHKLSQFLSKEHWLELIENKNIDTLQLLVFLPTKCWPLLYCHILVYIYIMQGKIQEKALHSVCHLLGTHLLWVLSFSDSLN